MQLPSNPVVVLARPLGPRRFLLAALLLLAGSVPAEGADGDYLAERLARKGIAVAEGDERPSIEALCRQWRDALGIGDDLAGLRRFFARGGECETRLPRVHARFSREAEFLSRPAKALERDFADFRLNFDLLRAAYCLLPMVVRPGAGGDGAIEVAPPKEWLLFQVEPELKDSLPGHRDEPDRCFRDFVVRDAALRWVRRTTAENARRAAGEFWEGVWRTAPQTLEFRQSVDHALKVLKEVPIDRLFGPRWDELTKVKGRGLYGFALVAVSLTARGRTFLAEYVPRQSSGELCVQSLGANPKASGRYDGVTRTLHISFGQSPPTTISTVVHEGTHALDDLANDRTRAESRMIELFAAEIQYVSNRARAAAAVGDALARDRYVSRLASLLSQFERIRFAGAVESEYLAWRAEGAFAGEMAFLLLTPAMVDAMYLLDRDLFEDHMRAEGGYALPPETVEACLRAKDWDAPEGLARPLPESTEPDPSELLPEDNAHAFVRIGDAYLELDLHTPARTAYEQALRMDPELPIAHQGLGDAWLAGGEPARAIRSYSRALEGAPRLVRALVGRAKAHGALGADRKALADLNSAVLAAGPGELEPWVVRGQLHFDAGDFAAALLDQDHVLEVSPDSPSLQIARARTYLELGDRDRARGDLDRVIEGDPEHAEARLVRAELSLLEGKFEAARRDADHVVARNRGLARAYQVRARILDAQGLPEAAAEDRERAAAAGD